MNSAVAHLYAHAPPPFHVLPEDSYSPGGGHSSTTSKQNPPPPRAARGQNPHGETQKGRQIHVIGHACLPEWFTLDTGKGEVGPNHGGCLTVCKESIPWRIRE
ncbi:hypothetical protein BaRGS_00021152 [Batillaria attramentaria]|uniref:Uncharacterized protein n=1 Tax=Batillaria attramentaria TaxID=370345 RepID=A0ABD0KKT5_9CAEN